MQLREEKQKNTKATRRDAYFRVDEQRRNVQRRRRQRHNNDGVLGRRRHSLDQLQLAVGKGDRRRVVPLGRPRQVRADLHRIQ